MSGTTGGAPARETILADLTRIVADIVQDWDIDFAGGVRGETRLVADLGFQSIDVVMLIGEIQKHYGRRNLPFERLLLREGRYVAEVRLADVADFLEAELRRAPVPAGAGGNA